MPPKKGVPWFVTEKAKTSPFDKFMADISKSLNVTTGTRLDPDWDIYAELMDKPENQQFKTMKDSKGMTAEDYGFKAFMASIKGALSVDPPDWAYYRDNTAYLPEFKDRKDETGKTAEDYGFETYMEIIEDILREDELDTFGEFLDYFTEFRTMKDDKGKTVMDYGFDKVKQMIDEREDKRKYSMLLQEHPEFFSMRDANGKTLLMYAADSMYLDAVVSMIKDGADVRLKDNEGKTVYEYTAEALDNELKHAMKIYKNDPIQLEREKKEIEASQRYFLKFIKDAETKAVAKEVATAAEPLTRVSKEFGKLIGDKKMDALALALKDVSGKAGEPGRVMAEARQQLGKGRKTRRKSKKSKKSRRV